MATWEQLMEENEIVKVLKEKYQEEYGDDYAGLKAVVIETDPWGRPSKLDHEPVLWYHKIYRLKLALSDINNTKSVGRKSHDLVIKFLNSHNDEKEKYLKGELLYFDILKLAEKEIAINTDKG